MIMEKWFYCSLNCTEWWPSKYTGVFRIFLYRHRIREVLGIRVTSVMMVRLSVNGA